MIPPNMEATNRVVEGNATEGYSNVMAPITPTPTDNNITNSLTNNTDNDNDNDNDSK